MYSVFLWLCETFTTRHHQILANKLEDMLLFRDVFLFEDVLPLKMCGSPLLCNKVLKCAFNVMSMEIEPAPYWGILELD